MFERFEFLLAYYAFCSDWHNGQRCELYVKLSRISRYLTPGPLFKGFESLNEYGQEVYHELEKKYGVRR